MAVKEIHRYSSVSAFVEAVMRDASGSTFYNQGSDYRWTGLHSSGRDIGPAACRLAVEGDPSLKAETSAAIDKLVPQYSEGIAQRWTPSVVGSRVNVPDYLSGSPTCMRRRIRRESGVRHLTVYVAVGCHSDVEASEMIARGAVILGMLGALQTQRISVDLKLVHELADGDDDRFLVIDVESKPLDLTSASFAIAHPSFFRVLGMALADSYGSYHGQFSSMARRLRKGSPEWCNYVRTQLGIEPTDVYVPYAKHECRTVAPEDIAARIQQHLDKGKGAA